MSDAAFVHLRVHSAYSLLEGALPLPRLIKLAKQAEMPAVAVTDTGNLFGALEFAEKASGEGLQPIIGCTLGVTWPSSGTDTLAAMNGPSIAGSVALLVMNDAGYANLAKLASAAFLEIPDGSAPHVTVEHLQRWNEGLICLSGGPDGPVDRALSDDNNELAEARLGELAQMFPSRLYVELQRHGTTAEREAEPKLVKRAYNLGLPLVATNQVYFATPDDHEAHDALICIADGTYVAADERRRITQDHYFKSTAEMQALFADVPEAIANTVEIAQRCCAKPVTRAPILPQFVATTPGADAAEQVAAEAAELTKQAEDGLRERLKIGGVAPDQTEDDYWERLRFELDIITRMQFPGYFLIVSDFIKWAKIESIPVGPGRGSGAGSVVAWALTITDLDPLRFGLLFERFLNPERVSMPDFDIDFCQDRRDEVIRYVQQKYGRDRVAQIITYGKLQARAVLRDVGRVLQMPYGQVDRLCKLVPNNPAAPVTLEEAIDQEERLQDERDSDETVAKLLELGQKLEGLYRHASTHAAGVVIGDRPLDELVPLYRDPRGDLPVTQFNMKWAEAAGLVKFDFLGLKTLTVIEKAVELIARKGVKLDLGSLGLDDRASYELLAAGDTAGVFQLESIGMRDSLKKLQPDRFEDIIAMVSLYRPGPMDNIPTYIARKHGLETVEYPHPLLEPILAETYGVIIYQEQVMQIAQVLSGYSLGEADLLRRAMGKKIKEEMAKQRTRFVEGAIANGVGKSEAGFIFDLVDKFAGYGFNKSHAAAYALLAYHTAYLKANHPVEFIAASMTLDMASTEKLAMFVDEARRLDIEVRPPCINRSGPDFEPEDAALRFALAALKNVGRGAIEGLCQERAENGDFKDLSDFATRSDPRVFNRRTLETLASAGAFEALESNRSTVYANADGIVALGQRTQADREAGQTNLFDLSGSVGTAPATRLEVRAAKPWLATERLTREFDAVGFYLTGHPLDQYRGLLPKLKATTWVAYEEIAHVGSAAIIGATITSVRVRRSQRGNKFAILGLSDPTGHFEVMIFGETLNIAGELIEVGKAVLAHVESDGEPDNLRHRANRIDCLVTAARRLQKRITVSVNGGTAWGHLHENLAQGSGEIELILRLPGTAREVSVDLPGTYDVSPERALLLRGIDGVMDVREH